MRRAIKELEELAAEFHQEAVAEHNEDDARLAFAVARGMVRKRIQALQQDMVADTYREWGR